METLQQFKSLDLIFLGDINVELDNAQRLWSQSVADLLMEFGLIDMVRHF